MPLLSHAFSRRPRLSGSAAPIRLVLLVVLAAIPGLPPWADANESPVLVATSERAVFMRGLLFRVAPSAKARPSWLFGTIHSEDPRVLALPQAVEQALAAARGVTVEVVPDSGAMRAAQARMLLGEGESLRERLPPALYRDTIGALAARGLPEAAAERFKPWAVIMLLSMPPSSTGQLLDLTLVEKANAAGKPVQGLETMAEQLAVFERLGNADQVALLEDTLANHDALPRLFDHLTHIYLARDLSGLLRLERQQLAGSDSDLATRFRHALVDKRNRRMAERIVPLVREGGNFIAVGALHLPGDGGLLDRLRDAGFVIECLY